MRVNSTTSTTPVGTSLPTGSQHTSTANNGRGDRNPFVGTRFAEMYDNNPYAHSHIQQTAWDRFVSDLGFRSSYDVAEAQRLQAYDEYNAQLSQLKSEDQYNSALGQAEQLAQAGINPMLSDISAGSAGEFAQEQTSPDLGASDTSSVLPNLAQGAIGLIQSAFGFYKQALDLGILSKDSKLKDLDLFSKQISNKNELLNAAANWLVHTVDEDTLKNFVDNPDNENWNNLLNAAKLIDKDDDSFSRKFGMTLDNFRKSSWMRTQIWKMSSESQGYRESYGTSASKYGSSDDIQEVVKVTGQFLKDSISAFKSKSKFDSEYWSNRNGVATAQNDEVNFDRNQVDNAVYSSFNESLENFTSKLSKMGSLGNMFASFVEMFAPLFFSKFMNSSFSFGSNGNSSMNVR